MSLAQLAAVTVAGGLGTLLRFVANGLVGRLCGHAFPWSTLVVNVGGSFLYGLIYAWAKSRGTIPPSLEVVLLVGFLGGFTTFSSFAFQAAEMLLAGRIGLALGYVLAMNLVGFVAAWAGIRMGGG